MNRAVNFSKKYRRSRMAEGEEGNVRRPTLFSMECSEQPGPDSSRARPIRQLTKPVPRDFTAYFHSSAEKNGDPACVVTSHHTREPLPRRRAVIPAYPCMQSLRWNPYVETSSIEEETDIPEEPEFNCKCESCATKKCPSRDLSSTTMRTPVFKDNIMTFCDRHTMTPRVNEVGCGCTPVPSVRVSDVSVTASNIAVKDTQASIQIHRLYNPEQSPASILKKNDREYPNYLHCCEHAYIPINCTQEPERDMGDECMEPSKITSIKSFFSCKKNKECSKEPRRNIYNEGISDMVANHFPVKPCRVPSPKNLKKDASKMSVRSRCYLDEGIPFSHRSDSRYHHNCKKSNSRSFYGDSDEVRHLVASPEIVRQTYASKPTKYHRIPTIRMPKRVLTSERDIESYIDRGYPKLTIPTRKSRGNTS